MFLRGWEGRGAVGHCQQVQHSQRELATHAQGENSATCAILVHDQIESEVLDEVGLPYRDVRGRTP